MKKKTAALLAGILLLALALAACGGGKGADSASGANSYAATSSAPQVAASESMAYDDSNMDMGYWEEVPADAPMEPMDNSVYGSVPANAKMIYTADLELESKEFDAAVQALTAAVTEKKGYFESRSISQGGRYRSMSCTVRVPVENYVTFLDLAGEAAHVTHRSDYSEDVSEMYYDSEARLTTQRTKLARLQELLSQAEDMADIITIESAISETELQIEYLTGSLRKYDSLINYSTVNINLYEVYRLSTDEEAPLTFGQRFGTAFLVGFQNGLASLDDLVISIARNWMVLLVWIAVIVIVVVVVRRLRRKKAAKSAPTLPTEPKESKTEKEE